MQFLKKYSLEIIFSIGFLIYAAIVNLQFLEASNVNYDFSGHDEYLTIREVYSILQPNSFKHFFMALVAGDVYFYGRMMFYTDALIAWIPFKIWGITGMVYTIRMAHVLFLLLGVTILSATFLKNNLGKIIFMLSTLTLYYTSYFVIIPKPEPMQLFMLALFLVFASKKNWAFGKHFIFLGMAYGLKFNVLTILPLFFLLPFFTGNKSFKSLIFSSLYFIGGLIIAMPGLLLSPVKPIFLKTYLRSTFGNTAHYDDVGASPVAWLEKGWFSIYMGGIIFGAIAAALILWLIIRAIKSYKENRNIDQHTVILLLGLGVLLPVMLFTKRLWPHYLWTGNLFIFLALTMFMQSLALNQKMKMVFTVCMLFVLAGVLKATYQKSEGILSLEKTRSAESEDGKKAHDYLRNKAANFVAIQDISVFYSFDETLEVNRYHPFGSSYPYKIPAQSFYWSDFLNPKILALKKADYLLVYKRDFENKQTFTNSAADKMIAQNDSLLRTELGKTIIPDTVFGKVKVYKIVNGGQQ